MAADRWVHPRHPVGPEGWLPIHHAIQATVYWAKAVEVVFGLVPLMMKSRDTRPPEGWLGA